MEAKKIRLAEPEDAVALAALNRDFNGSPVTSGQIESLLRSGTDPEVVLVAEVEGCVAGFACLRTMSSVCYPHPWAELTELYVQPSHRRCGIGRALVQEAERVARAQGAVEMHLLAGAENAAGQALYRALGYQAQPRISLWKRLEQP